MILVGKSFMYAYLITNNKRKLRHIYSIQASIRAPATHHAGIECHIFLGCGDIQGNEIFFLFPQLALKIHEHQKQKRSVDQTIFHWLDILGNYVQPPKHHLRSEHTGNNCNQIGLCRDHLFVDAFNLRLDGFEVRSQPWQVSNEGMWVRIYIPFAGKKPF